MLTRRDLAGMGIFKITPEVLKFYGPKCERCWRFGDEVGQLPKYKDLCFRCASVISDMEEGINSKGEYPELETDIPLHTP